jgi:hypothetical protein
MSEKKIVPGSDFRDRRQNRRENVTVNGRLALPDGSEHNCVTLDISPSGLALRTSRTVAIGERIVVDLAEMGRFEGAVVRSSKNRIVIAFNLDTKKRGRLARRIEIFKALHARNISEFEANFPAEGLHRNIQRLSENMEIVLEVLVPALPG